MHAETGVGAGGSLPVAGRLVGGQCPLKVADTLLQVGACLVDEDAESLGEPGPFHERPPGPARARGLAGAADRRATFPSDTLSTHFLFPNTLERLATLGVMERLHASHDIPRLLWSWRVLGHQVAGAFTPVAGEDRLTCIRRVTLDAALVEEALAAGVVGRFGERVSGVVGAGRPGDPVRGVVLAGGDVVRAPWVIGADGRRSTVARALGLAATRELTGNLAFMFAYWTGLPATEWFRMDVREDLSLVCCPCEDGVHQLVLAGFSRR